jgi:hypothetical protein
VARRIGGWSPSLYVEREASPDRVVFTAPKGGCGVLFLFVLSSILLPVAVANLRGPESMGCGVPALLAGALALIVASKFFFRQQALLVDLRTAHVEVLLRSPFRSRGFEIPFDEIREIEIRKSTDVLYASQLTVIVNLADGRYIALGSGRPQLAQRLAWRLSALTGRPSVDHW